MNGVCNPFLAVISTTSKCFAFQILGFHGSRASRRLIAEAPRESAQGNDGQTVWTPQTRRSHRDCRLWMGRASGH